MTTTTSHSGLIERVSFCAYFGCCPADAPLDLGSTSRESTSGSVASCAGVRLTTNTGRLRHDTASIWPALILASDWVTGAPAALARALGSHDLMKGTAADTIPMPPTTAVVAVRKRRRP